MKKILCIAFSVAAIILVSAQEIKVKKDEIQVDGKSIARIERSKKSSSSFVVSDLKKNPLFTAEITSYTPLGNQSPDKWLQLTGINGVVKEVPLAKIPEKQGGSLLGSVVGLNPFKIMKVALTAGGAEDVSKNLIFNDASLITTKGVDADKINSFFQTEDRSISSKVDEYLEPLKKEAASDDEIARNHNIQIDGTGLISADGQPIGLITKIDLGNQEMKYRIGDMNNTSIAVILYQPNDLPGYYQLVTFEDKTFPIYAEHNSDRTADDELARRSVYKLYANGYTLGNMSERIKEQNERNREEYNKKLQAAKDNSINIYDQPGYIIDKDGNRVDGKITLRFESLDNKLDPKSKNSGMSDLTQYGTGVGIKLDNGKGMGYKAREGVKVYVGDRTLVGTASMADGNLGNSSDSQLSLFGEAQFFDAAYESNGDFVLFHVRNPQYYYLKLGDNKAVYLGSKGGGILGIGTKKPERIQKIFDDYVKCPALNFSDYDTSTKDGLIQVITDYQQKCEK